MESSVSVGGANCVANLPIFATMNGKQTVGIRPGSPAPAPGGGWGWGDPIIPDEESEELSLRRLHSKNLRLLLSLGIPLPPQRPSPTPTCYLTPKSGPIKTTKRLLSCELPRQLMQLIKAIIRFSFNF